MRHLKPPILNWLSALLLLFSISASAAATRELQERRQRAAAAFSDGLLVVHARSAVDTTADGFLQDPVFYYLTGLENAVGAILAIDGRSRQSWLFLPPAPPPHSKDASPTSDSVKQAGIEHVVDWLELNSFLEKNAAASTVLYYSRVRYSIPDLPPNVAGDPPAAPLWAVTIARKWPAFVLKPVGPELTALLDVQCPSELVSVRAASTATTKAVMAGIRAIHPGATQHSVETAVAEECVRAGAHGVSFRPWAMAGTTGVFPTPFVSMFRYDHLDAVMNSGDLVRLDVGCEVGHYGGDLGRTVPVSGHYGPDQREIWNIFVSAYRAGVKALREGVTDGQVFEAWRTELLKHRESSKSALAKQAIEEWSKRENVPYWEIHTMNLTEGSGKGPLRAGTTIAFEPIASIAGQGYYLEDLFLITKTGAELLTPDVPYSAEEIEAAMQR